MTTYAQTGVSLETAVSITRSMQARGAGLFGGMVGATRLKDYDNPVLVSSMDGVGTKVRLASRLSRLDGLGADLVHHCANDIAVHGAQPIFFLDYLAFHHVDAPLVERLLGSISSACSELNIDLCGGETAEMPRTYRPGEFDIAGTIVGVVEKDAIVDGSSIQSGDILLGLASSGVHTNGFSLVQAIFTDADYGLFISELDTTLGEALLAPHRCYCKEITKLLASGQVHGIAHITGGGIPGNLSRIMPNGLEAIVEISGWPPLFQMIHEQGVTEKEMGRVFNLGVGLIAVCDPSIDVDGEWKQIGLVRMGETERRVAFSSDL